jgi:hypothetical protein
MGGKHHEEAQAVFVYFFGHGGVRTHCGLFDESK